MPTTPSIRFCTLKWMRMHRFPLSIGARGGLLLIPLPSTFCFRSVLSTITDNDPLLVVSRGSTRNEKMQIADLPSGTMRRISRARSSVSGVELWHPAKPLLENRVEFVHCIVIIMHYLH